MLSALLAPLAALVVAPGAVASLAHPSVVSEDPANYTPDLGYNGTEAKPHVDALDQEGSTIYAGGLFNTVVESGGTTYTRRNLMAFDANSGGVRAVFNTTVDGNVWAVEAVPGAVYIGGAFSTVNGVARAALAKLDPVTGALDASFKPPFTRGNVYDLEMRDGRLIVAGSAGKKLVALNPTTGQSTGYIALPVTDPIPNARGGVAVYSMAISPAGKLVATGNFQTVNGAPRTRLFVANLGQTSATLDPWYYPGFAKPCSSTNSRRIAYLQGVDFSPDGSYFVVAATGQIPKSSADIWPAGSAQYHTVCDAIGKFNLSNDQAPAWINYTGGDSVWSVAATGAAVYAQGHFEWLDNPNGWASTCPTGDPCASRKGIGAIHPSTGKALAWNPSKPAQIGGKAFLVTNSGLWVGSDSTRFNGENHRGIAFAPLP